MQSLHEDFSHGNSRSRFDLPDKIIADRRPTLLKFAAHLRARGRTREEIESAVITANFERCSPPLKKLRDLHDLRRIAEWAASKPAGVSEKGTISNADKQVIEQALAFIADFPWHGIASNNARIVAYAVLHKMKELGRLTEIGFSCRALAEEVGLSFAATAAALRRLCGIGKDRRPDVPILFLRTIHKGHVEDSQHLSVKALAYEYSLNIPAISTHTVSHESIVVLCVDSAALLSIVSHDAFLMRGVGLRRSAGLVYAALPCRTEQEIATKTCLSLRTVRDALKALKSEALVEKNEKTALWTRTCETLEVVAQRRRTAGEGKRRKEKHEKDRKDYSAYLMRPRTKKRGTLYKLYTEVPSPVWWEDEWRDAA